MTQTTRDTLIAARDLIADRSHWTSGTEYDGNGRYCARGAVRFVSGNRHSAMDVAIDALTNAAIELYHQNSIVYINDHYRHAATMRCFDYAIAQQPMPEEPPRRRSLRAIVLFPYPQLELLVGKVRMAMTLADEDEDEDEDEGDDGGDGGDVEDPPDEDQPVIPPPEDPTATPDFVEEEPTLYALVSV